MAKSKAYKKFVEWAGYTTITRTLRHKKFPDGKKIDIIVMTTPNGMFYKTYTHGDAGKVEHESEEAMRQYVNKYLRGQKQ